MDTTPVPRRASIADLLLLAVILTVAAWLRFSALSNGLPSSPQVDEPEIVDRALHMMRTGTYNPAPFFDYPALYIYVQAMTAVAYFIGGALDGAWSSLAQASSADFYWGFYAWGRGVTAALGTATVLLTYAIARRIGRVAALTAAALLATQPMHVRESHYILTDVPMTFFVTLTIWLSVRASERGNTRAFLGAGLAAGLAAATKYNGGVVILAPLLAAVLTERSSRTGRWLFAVVGGAAVAFIAGAPFTVLDLPAFLDSFAHLINQYARPAAPAHVLYLKHLRINLGTPALILIAAGAALAVYRLRAGTTSERVAWAATSLFAVTWFMMIAGQAIVFGRYLLPLLPAVLVILGGAIGGIEAALRRFVPRPGWSTAVAAGLVALVLTGPTLASVNFVSNISKTWTMALARDWIAGHVPAGARVVVETRALLLPADRYVSSNQRRLIDRPYEDYRKEEVQYLVASSDAFGRFMSGPDASTDLGGAYRQLFRQLELVHMVAPSTEHPGPEIRIYRLHP